MTPLKALAVATGINSSGTKSDLTSRIVTELHNATRAPRTQRREPHRIISIDMGIRNLAYCVISVDGAGIAKATANATVKARVSKNTLPVIEDWTRIAVSAKLSNPASSPRKDSLTTAITPVPKATPKEPFDPSTYATHAYALISRLLHTHSPSTILIERQRYRSMGGAAVQEWTLRVNMFEAMIHAVLETLAREGRWAGEVWAVSPAKVGSFWLGKADGEEGPKGRDGKKGNKSAKIDIVGSWLEDGDREIRLRGDAKAMAGAFLDKWKGKGKGRRKGAVGVETDVDADTVIGKLDDLADCLLQGIAWLKWQENKRRIVEGDGGVEALEMIAVGKT